MNATRCEVCLQLTYEKGSCTDPECAAAGEQWAQMLLSAKGYRLHDGSLNLVVNDDPDDWNEKEVSPWGDTAAEAYRQLMRHRFPTDLIECGACHLIPVERLGEDCYDCADENRREADAEIWANS